MATNYELAMLMLPHLIRWAQGAWDTPHYCSDLSKIIHHNSNQIGAVLGVVQDILDDVAKESHKGNVPTLNCLVQNKETGIPSYGFEYVDKKYNSLSNAEKRAFARAENEKAHKYDWTWVIEKLGLKLNYCEQVLPVKYANVGEGEEHKAIKQYIASNPDMVGIKKVLGEGETEHLLLSGDRIDVFFRCKNNMHYAVEVKPSTSDDADILRGIFQCVKYKAVMDSERVWYGGNYENETVLVVSRELSERNKCVAVDLGVRYIERFKCI